MKTENVDPMNTEQLKTAHMMLQEAKEDLDNVCLATKYVLEDDVILNLMDQFASLERKRAVDEFKEKLKVDIKYMRNRTFKQDGMPVGENEDFVRGCDDIIDLIDKL